ncbi:phosphatase 2C-like domain-containing protein [Kockovaella imperatae]|uniref:Phosphatase 2C-like domain-containing protein n=1 Tax=Kockovaella imperatae TaxID=4999 RepID=A0A1Y1UI93_9TREE|nr:phosphatase 2C-like domain-containing protein [Kockovaella imperatae]ORX37257.1 phosphatase 2C-like domain-containing protein [Kockovaella imperatae]
MRSHVTRRLISQWRGSEGGRRASHDFIRGPTPGGTFKVPFPSPKIVGIQAARGTSAEQQDQSAVHALQLSPAEIQYSLEKIKYKWDASKAGSPFLASQVAFFGIYDGHGGAQVSTHLAENLHNLIESVQSDHANSLVQWTKSTHQGYFKRWRGGVLSKWTKAGQTSDASAQTSTSGPSGKVMTLEERLTLAFLQADQDILKKYEESHKMGSTASVLLLHSLDSPAVPYWAAKEVFLTVGHCGDTRVLLCHAPTGKVVPLTERHHAEARVEAARLRRMGADNLIQDSFGESKWMGAIENTRGFGDGDWKSSGVTAEPEVISRVLKGAEYSYLVLVTDGLTDLMSDQEIIDLARNASDPTRAATTIIHFGEDLNADDNCTCIVVPLAGWGQVKGQDSTEARREYRRNQAGMMNTRMQRM